MTHNADNDPMRDGGKWWIGNDDRDPLHTADNDARHLPDWTGSLPGEPPSCACGFNGTPDECASWRAPRTSPIPPGEDQPEWTPPTGPGSDPWDLDHGA